MSRQRRHAVLAFVSSFLVVAASVAALSLSGGPSFARPAVVQPVAFSHERHVKELDLACTSCHTTVETEAFSGLPDAEVCAFCHQEAQGKSGEEKTLLALLASGKPLAWRPLFRQPAHVFYSHRRHVVVAKIGCPVCHGSIASTSLPPEHVKKLRMDDCMECHRRSGVATGCTTCHR